MSPEEIVTTFTNMLFEEKILLVTEKVEELLPISFALHSLIYPFEMCIFIPILVDDGEEPESNSINLVSSPTNYFIGISKKEKKFACDILKEDEFPAPLLINLASSKKRIGKDLKTCLRVL